MDGVDGRDEVTSRDCPLAPPLREPRGAFSSRFLALDQPGWLIFLD